MRSAVITAAGHVEVREIPVPEVGDTEILVKVGAVGLCTMEANLYSGRMPIYPTAAGHEISGRVAQVGAAAAELDDAPQVGDLVTVDLLKRCGTCRPCRNGLTAVCESPQGVVRDDGAIPMGAGLADYVKVPAGHVWTVGDADPEHSAMGEPLACVVHSLRRGSFTAGDRVTVIGAGFMGHLHLALTRHYQARSVVVVEQDAERRAAIAGAGADAVVSPEELPQQPKADVVFVTITSAASIAAALSACADGGRIVLFGGSADAPAAELPGYEVHRRQLTVTGSYSQEPADWRVVAELLRGGTLSSALAPLVTSRYSLDDVEKGLKQAAETPVYRVIVNP